MSEHTKALALFALFSLVFGALSGWHDGSIITGILSSIAVFFCLMAMYTLSPRSIKKDDEA